MSPPSSLGNTQGHRDGAEPVSFHNSSFRGHSGQQAAATWDTPDPTSFWSYTAPLLPLRTLLLCPGAEPQDGGTTRPAGVSVNVSPTKGDSGTPGIVRVSGFLPSLSRPVLARTFLRLSRTTGLFELSPTHPLSSVPLYPKPSSVPSPSFLLLYTGHGLCQGPQAPCQPPCPRSPSPTRPGGGLPHQSYCPMTVGTQMSHPHCHQCSFQGLSHRRCSVMNC